MFKSTPAGQDLGFVSLMSLLQDHEKLNQRLMKGNGGIFFMETRYKSRTQFGGPGSDHRCVNATRYTLGGNIVIKDDYDVVSSLMIPCGLHVSWEDPAFPAIAGFGSFRVGGALDCPITDQSVKLSIGYDEIFQHMEQSISLGFQPQEQRAIAFWKAGQLLMEDFSVNEVIRTHLNDERKKVLSAYVYSKFLFVTNPTDRKLLRGVDDEYRKLLRLGLLKDEITEKAEALAIEQLGL